MNSDEHLCFIPVSLQFPYDLSFAEFTLTPLNHHCMPDTVFLHQWLIILSWLVGSATYQPGQLKERQGFLQGL